METIISALPAILISGVVSLAVSFLTSIWISHYNDKHFDRYHKNEKESHILDEAPSVRKMTYREDQAAAVTCSRTIRATVEVSATGDPASPAPSPKRYKCFKFLNGDISNADLTTSSQWVVIIVNNQSSSGIKIDSISTTEDDRLSISTASCLMVDTQEVVRCFFPYRDSPTAIYATFRGLKIVYPFSESSEFSTPYKAR